MQTHLKKKDFEILDSIRGIASLYVVIAHCRGTAWMGGSEFMKMFPRNTWDLGDYLIFGTSMLTRLAVEFVIVFFVLSGFSIAHSLSGDKSPGKFYLRRFIRIYPSYLTALFWAGVVYFITKLLHPDWYNITFGKFFLHRTVEMYNYFDWDIILKNLFYMPSTGFITPFWSLTYEVIFYLLAPFLLRRHKLYSIISLILFLINLFIPSAVLSLKLPVYIYTFLFIFNIYFALGVTIYKNFAWIQGQLQKLARFKLHIIMSIVLLAMYALNLYFEIETVYSFAFAATLSCLLIFYFINYQVRIPWLMGVGKFSYTLYITHYASVYMYLGIYFTVFNPKEIYIVNFFVWIPAVFFCLFIAWMQYSIVEKKTKKILDKLRKPGGVKEPASAITSAS